MKAPKLNITYVLNENMRPVITLLVFAGVYKIIYMVLLKEVKAAENVTMFILGNILGILGTVVAFYFVSSKSAADRTKVELEAKSAESVVSTLTEVKQTPAPVKPIDEDMKFKLTGLGYLAEDIVKMTYDEAMGVIDNGKVKK